MPPARILVLLATFGFAVLPTGVYASFVFETSIWVTNATSVEYFVTSPTDLEFEPPGASDLGTGWSTSIINSKYVLLTGTAPSDFFPDLHFAGTEPSAFQIATLFWDGEPLGGTLLGSGRLARGSTFFGFCPGAGDDVCGTEYVSSFDRSSVPEPITLALFGLGLAGLGTVRRKKLLA